MHRRHEKFIPPRKGAMAGLPAWRPWRIEETSALAALSVCTILTLGLYLSPLTIGSGGGRSFHSVPEAAPPAPVKFPPFQLSGVQLGMTPLEAGSAQPGIILTGGRRAEQKGRFRLGNGVYTVSFRGAGAGKRAYRIHYAETFWNFTEIEIRRRLNRKFGKPHMDRCGMENSEAGWVCRLRWLYSGDITIDAVTRTSPAAQGMRKTKLELVALDQKMENRKKWRMEEPNKTAFARRMRALSAAARGM